jgi:hypothetical protein
MSKFIWPLVFMLIGAVLVYAFTPTDPLIHEHVIIPARQIIEREPDTVRTFIDRIRYISPDPVQTSVAPGGSAEQVQQFCEPTLAAQTETEPGTPVDPMLLLRSVSYDRRWAFRKDRLFVSGPTSYGDLVGIDYDVRGDWTLRTLSPSTTIVQYPRTSLLYDLWEGGTQIYAGYKILTALLGALQ